MNSFRPPAPSAPRLTRRTLLRGLGGAAALAVLPAPRCLAAEEASARARRGSAPLKITRVRTILTAPQNRIRVHLSQIGGFTPARKLAALAEPFHVRSAWHGPGDVSPVGHAANAHLDLAIWNFGIQEAVRFTDATREVFPGAPTMKNGYLHINEAPGWGVDLNEEAAKKFPLPEHPGYWQPVRRNDGTSVKP